MNFNFDPVQTILAAVTTAASVGVSPSSGGGMQAAELTNLSTNTIFGEFFPTSTGAVTLPTTGTAAAGFCLPPSAKNVRFVTPPAAFASFITTGTGLTGLVSFTAGQYL